MKKVNENTLSDYFYVLKAVAIFTIIFAHCNLEKSNYISGVYSNIGTIGVGIFLFTAGFYFNPAMNMRAFGRKFVNTLIPWVIASSVIWLEVGIRHGELSLRSYLFHLIGYGSIFYFFTIYFLSLIIAIILLNKVKLNCTFTFIVSVVVNFAFVFLEDNAISFFPSPYLNPFIFISFFFAGCLSQKYKEKFVKICNSWLPLLGGVALGIVFLPEISTYYWKWPYEIVLEFGLILFNLFVARVLLIIKKQIVFVGKNTLFIYIWHLIPMTAVNYIGNRFSVLQKAFVVWPIVVFLIMVFAILIIQKINQRKLNWLLGIRA